jgi:hypothetical protein
MALTVQRAVAIAVPSPDLTLGQMIARAAAMYQLLTDDYRDISMYRLHATSRARYLAPQLAAVHTGLTDVVLPAGPG